MLFVLETIRDIMVEECGFNKEDVYVSSETEKSPRWLDKYKAIIAYRVEINPNIDFCGRRIGKTDIKIFITKNNTELLTHEKAREVMDALKKYPTPIKNETERLVAFNNIRDTTAGILGPGREILTIETSVIHENI